MRGPHCGARRRHPRHCAAGGAHWAAAEPAGGGGGAGAGEGGWRVGGWVAGWVGGKGGRVGASRGEVCCGVGASGDRSALVLAQAGARSAFRQCPCKSCAGDRGLLAVGGHSCYCQPLRRAVPAFCPSLPGLGWPSSMRRSFQSMPRGEHCRSQCSQCELSSPQGPPPPRPLWPFFLARRSPPPSVCCSSFLRCGRPTICVSMIHAEKQTANHLSKHGPC